MSLLTVNHVKNLPKMEGGFIFNSPEFQSLKEGDHLNFVLLKDSSVIARIWFHIIDGTAISGHHATFGSIDFNATLNKENINYFLTEVLNQLVQRGIKEIIIKHWPIIYCPGIDELLFQELAFKQLENNINQHLVVTPDTFDRRIKKNEKKKLAQSIKKDYKFNQLTITALKEIYQLIEDTRGRKNYPVSMSYRGLYETVKRMQGQYLLFGLYDADRLIAASVSIRTSDDILYNFYHADDINYRSTSPLVLLLAKIYEFCQLNEINILDLGISSEKGIINEGLFNFKRNLGCETSAKYIYRLINE